MSIFCINSSIFKIRLKYMEKRLLLCYNQIGLIKIYKLEEFMMNKRKDLESRLKIRSYACKTITTR